MMDLGEVIDQVKNDLDARQVNSQVALIGHDRPEPPDLRGLVAFFGPFMGDVHESERLVAHVSTLVETASSRAARSRGMIRRVMADALPY